MTTDTNPRAVMGGNQPPEPSRKEVVFSNINDLDATAKDFCDGVPVTSQEMDDTLARLDAELAAASKEADAIRTALYKPINDEKAAIQEEFLPFIGGAKCDGGKVGNARAAIKALRTPWLRKVEAEKKAKADALKAEAAETLRLAQEAHRAADATNLAEKAESDRLLAEAEKAGRIAKAADKAATTKTGLKTRYEAEITNLTDLLRHIWAKDEDGLRVFAQGWADTATRNASGQTTIPGVVIHTVKEAR